MGYVMDVKVARMLIDDLLDFLTNDEYIALAKILKVQVPGFSIRYIGNAPIPILKKPVRTKLQKLSNPAKFLIKWNGEHLDSYQDLSKEEFILKMSLKNEFTPAKKVVLFGILYPNDYPDQRKKISDNISEGRDPFDGILDNPPSMKDHLNFLAESEKELGTQFLNRVVQSIVSQDRMEKDNKQRLEDYLQKHGIPPLYEGHYLRLMNLYQEEYKTLSISEKHPFLNLAFLDLLHYTNTMQDELAKLKLERNNFSGKIEHLEQRCEEQKKQLIKERMNRNELERSLAENEKKRNEMQKRYKTQLGEIEKARQSLEQNNASLTQELNRLQEEFRTQAEKQPSHYLLDQPEIKILTIIDDLELHYYIDPQQIYERRNVEELIHMIEEHGEEWESYCLFINSDGISTKDQFRVENVLRPYSLRWKFVSGGTASIIRAITYYMEGDQKYET